MEKCFVHLRVHSEYSLVDSLVRLSALVSNVAKMSMPAVGLTDLNNLFGLIKFYKSARKNGIKPIAGADVLVKYPEQEMPQQLVLLVQNQLGYKNLTQLISKAYLSKENNGAAVIEYSWLVQFNIGLIALSGGVKGEIGNLITSNKTDQANKSLIRMKGLFGNRFYLEIQRTGRFGEEKYNDEVVQLALEHDCPIVATNDVRFIEKNEYEAHEARVCIHDSRLLEDPRRERLYSDQQFLRSADEMETLFSDLPEAIDNTFEIAKRCNLSLTLGENYLPEYPIPGGLTANDYLKQQSHLGLENKFKLMLKGHQDTIDQSDYALYRERLNYELEIIIEMDFSGYFLIVMDFIIWAKGENIPVGPGRGSGAGSLIAYVLGITDLDPIKHDLLFERFMNPERVSMPDFDIDFCMEGRDRVISYVSDRYGRESVSQIVTFGTLSARAVVRDVARVLGKSYGLGDKLSKLIPFEVGITLEAARLKEQELDDFIRNDDDAAEIWDMAIQLEGITRNCGKHAGGVVISPSKITDYTPIYCDESGSTSMTQFDKNDVEDVGLVKFDFLGLRTLTIIDWALELINRREPSNSKKLNLDEIPINDKETFDFMQSGRTTAVFQLESRGMKELIKKLGPDRFDDIVALVALFRPGPLQSGMVDDFISRKKGEAEISYPHPKYQHQCLEPALSSTYGVILYQEQVMQIAQEMGGYTLGGADILRRAMGKKNAKEMAEQREVFIKGAQEKGFNQDLASNIFDLMEKFAGYGFNKSHSAAYALLAYQTAWLKTHHAPEFMAATMSSDMDKTDKVVTYIEDCRDIDIELKPPSINEGEFRFSVNEQGAVVYGLGAIKGLGEGVIELIITTRVKDGKFKDIYDFCARVDTNKLSKRAIEALIKAGAFDEIGPSESINYCRAWLITALDDASKLADQVFKNEESGIEDLFGNSLVETSEEIKKNIPLEIEPLMTKERLEQEKSILGLYLTGHPLDEYKLELEKMRVNKLADIKNNRGKIRAAGLITDIRVMKNKKGQSFAFITLDDKYSRAEVTLWAETYAKYREYLQKDAVVLVKGEASQDRFTGRLKIIIDTVQSLYEVRCERLETLEVVIADSETDWVDLLTNRVSDYRDGNCSIKIEYHKDNSYANLLLDDSWKIDPRDELIDQLRSDFGPNNVNFEFR